MGLFAPSELIVEIKECPRCGARIAFELGEDSWIIHDAACMKCRVKMKTVNSISLPPSKDVTDIFEMNN